MTTSTITTIELDAAIAENEATLARRTAEMNDLEAQQKRDVAAQSDAIAGGEAETIRDLRQAVRDRAADIAAQAGAINSINRRIAEHKAERKATEARETRERAQEGEAHFRELGAQFGDKLRAAALELVELFDETRAAMNIANTDYYTADRLDGKNPTGLPRLYMSNADEEVFTVLRPYSTSRS